VDAKQALQQRVKQLSAAVRTEPGSIARRLELAAALRELGRANEAIDLYRGVASLYAEEGRFAQAIAVCRGILEIDPQHVATQELLSRVAARKSSRERLAPRLGWTAADFDDLATDGGEDKTTVGEPSFVERTPPPDLPPLDEGDDDRETTDPVASAAALRSPPAGRAKHERTAPDLDPAAPDEDALLAAALGTPWPPPQPPANAPPFPLLGDLPRAAFVDLVSRLKVRHESPGTVLVREGEPGEACYLIASGTVRVTKAGIEVAQLGAGSFFGEFAVLADQRRHASVEVVEPVELLEISRQLLDQLTAEHPGVARTLRRFYRERLLETLIATAPFFQPLSSVERTEVAQRFRPRRFGRGARIVEENAPGGGLYLVLVGEVEVIRGDGEGEVRLASLGEGSYFGEMSLLRGGAASATVRATRTTEAVQLPPRDFYELVSHLPMLWDALRTEAARRELLNHSILTGEARKSSDGQIYLL
jgi:CRP-like cAMP-binding protein